MEFITAMCFIAALIGVVGLIGAFFYRKRLPHTVRVSLYMVSEILIIGGLLMGFCCGFFVTPRLD